MSRITDEEVTKLLRNLPKREASSRFTREVLNRLERLERPHLVLRHPWAVGAAVAVVLLGLSAAIHRNQQSGRLRSVERVETLRNEYRELEAEVEKLRSLARELDPVIELGGTERVDFVFDLRELAKENNRPGLQPVSHTHTSEEKQ